MNCLKCRNVIPSGVKFCAYCGARSPGPAREEAAVGGLPKSGPITPPYVSPHRRVPLWTIMSGGFVFTAAVILAAYFLFPLSKAAAVSDFAVSYDDSYITAKFILLDSEQNMIAEDGSAHLRIYDKLGDTLYDGKLRFTKGDFRKETGRGGFVRTPSGVKVVPLPDKLYAELKIPSVQLKKSPTRTGRATLSLSLKGFKSLVAEDSEAYLYSQEDWKRRLENDYLERAVSVRMRQVNGNLAVDVVRWGFHDTYLPSLEYEGKKAEPLLRVDLRATNIGNVKDYLRLGGAALFDDSGNVYQARDSRGKFTGKDILPGQTEEDFLLFEVSNKSARSFKLLWGYWCESQRRDCVFEFDLGEQFIASYNVKVSLFESEELAKIAEVRYLRNALDMGVTQVKGNFEVQVLRWGTFDKRQWKEDAPRLFRTDVAVKNRGKVKDRLSRYDVKLVDNTGRQYEASYNSTVKSEDIYPGVVIEGYLLVENLSKDAKGFKLFWQYHSADQGREYLFEFQLGEPF